MIYKGIDAMSKLHVKKGDTVYVNTGENLMHKILRGAVLRKRLRSIFLI